MNLVLNLTERGVINPPNYVPHNIHYLIIAGSESYGVATDFSDKDIKGFFIPPKDVIFPNLRGCVPGYDWPSEKAMKKAHLWEIHHVKDEDLEYDFRIDSIVKLFNLAKDCNPDIIDSLFVPTECVIHITEVGEMVRENRHLFLSKKGWNTFKGYAYQQLQRMSKPAAEGKRKALVEEHGYDTKFSYHIVRLLNEIEQILTTGDLDIRANREQLKSIRRGEWSHDEIVQYAQSKERELEKVKNESSLSEEPDYKAIKKLMLNCIEHHYGSMEEAIVEADRSQQVLRQIDKILRENQNCF